MFKLISVFGLYGTGSNVPITTCKKWVANGSDFETEHSQTCHSQCIRTCMRVAAINGPTTVPPMTLASCKTIDTVKWRRPPAPPLPALSHSLATNLPVIDSISNRPYTKSKLIYLFPRQFMSLICPLITSNVTSLADPRRVALETVPSESALKTVATRWPSLQNDMIFSTMSCITQ